MKLELGSVFETHHGSKWTVVKMTEEGFEAKSSDNVPHRFTAEGKFVREDYKELHPYDYKRAWIEREQEEAKKSKSKTKAKG